MCTLGSVLSLSKIVGFVAGLRWTEKLTWRNPSLWSSKNALSSMASNSRTSMELENFPWSKIETKVFFSCSVTDNQLYSIFPSEFTKPLMYKLFTCKKYTNNVPSSRTPCTSHKNDFTKQHFTFVWWVFFVCFLFSSYLTYRFHWKKKIMNDSQAVFVSGVSTVNVCVLFTGIENNHIKFIKVIRYQRSFPRNN